MSIFALDNETLKRKKAVFTATEIDQQPKVWQRTIDILAEKKKSWSNSSKRLWIKKSTRSFLLVQERVNLSVMLWYIL